MEKNVILSDEELAERLARNELRTGERLGWLPRLEVGKS